MPKITYVDHAGTERTVEGSVGATVMETALRNNVPGIDAECGGACACATCHVYVSDEWIDVVGKAQTWSRTCSISPPTCARIPACPARSGLRPNSTASRSRPRPSRAERFGISPRQRIRAFAAASSPSRLRGNMRWPISR